MRELGEGIDWIGDPLSPLEARKTEIVRPSAVDEVNVLLDEYALRLDQMRATAADSVSEFKLGRAAMDSLSGMDEKVVVALSEPDSAVDSRAERLLAASLFKTGDAAQDASRLKESVRIWRGYIAKGDIRDRIAFLRLGDALQALADLRGETVAAAGAPIEAGEPEDPRGASVAAYEEAVTTIDAAVNEAGWREAREKYATAVIEFGTKGAALDKLDLAIQGLRDVLESGRVGPAPLARAEAYDKLSALYLMRADRTAAPGDFQSAVEASQQALDMISNERGSTTAAVMQRNLAAAVRGLAEHRQKEGLAEEAIDELRRAAALYRSAGEAYLEGVRDADRADARLAAAETLDEARDIYRAIGSEDEAMAVEVILASLASPQPAVGAGRAN